MTGIGPATQAWEAWILPLNYIRKGTAIASTKQIIV